MQTIVRNCMKQLAQKTIERVQAIVLDHICPSEVLPISFRPSETNERVTFPMLQELEVVSYNSFILTDVSLCTPSLKRLRLHGCSVDWKAVSLLRNLSYLVVSTIGDTVADLGAIYKALCQMPNLVSLHIRPTDLDSRLAVVVPAAPKQPAPLPNLRSMWFDTDSPIWLSSILQSIPYGPRRDVSINMDCDTSNIKEFLAAFPSIVQHAKESSIRSLYIRCITGVFFFKGYNYVGILEPLRFDVSIEITLQFPKEI